jgi:hypothetical protein
LIQLLAAQDALFDKERSEARERAFVVARREVLPRLHSLDRVPVFVHVEDAKPHGESVKRIGAHLPIGVKGRRVMRVANGAETLPAAHVVHSIHPDLELV